MARSAFRLALVGLGNAGTQLHLPALVGVPEADVVGACDIDPDRRARVASQWELPVYDDFDKMLRQARPDVVIVGTPPQTHAEYCLRSLARGAHVVCEKPFVSSISEADQVIDAARDAGRKVALNHEFREMPIFRAILDATTGEDVVLAQLWQMMDLPPWAEPGWRGLMLQRTLYEAGVHLVDFLLALFREKPLAVTATMSTCGVRDEQSDAVALVTLEFSRGRLGHVIQNRLCKGETLYFEARADTHKGSLRASFGGRARFSFGLFRSPRPGARLEYGLGGLAWSEAGGKRRHLCRNPSNPGMIATRALLRHTLAAFAAGSRPPATAEDGRNVLEVLAASYKAASSGCRVPIEQARSGEVAALQMGATSSI
jgi:predicted dehydrogenase